MRLVLACLRPVLACVLGFAHSITLCSARTAFPPISRYRCFFLSAFSAGHRIPRGPCLVPGVGYCPAASIGRCVSPVLQPFFLVSLCFARPLARVLLDRPRVFFSVLLFLWRASPPRCRSAILGDAFFLRWSCRWFSAPRDSLLVALSCRGCVGRCAALGQLCPAPLGFAPVLSPTRRGGARAPCSPPSCCLLVSFAVVFRGLVIPFRRSVALPAIVFVPHASLRLPASRLLLASRLVGILSSSPLGQRLAFPFFLPPSFFVAVLPILPRARRFAFSFRRWACFVFSVFCPALVPGFARLLVGFPSHCGPLGPSCFLFVLLSLFFFLPLGLFLASLLPPSFLSFLSSLIFLLYSPSLFGLLRYWFFRLPFLSPASRFFLWCVPVCGLFPDAPVCLLHRSLG